MPFMSKDARIVHALDRLRADRFGLNLAGCSRTMFDDLRTIGFAVLFGIAAMAPAHADTPGLDFNDNAKTVKTPDADRK